MTNAAAAALEAAAAAYIAKEMSCSSQAAAAALVKRPPHVPEQRVFKFGTTTFSIQKPYLFNCLVADLGVDDFREGLALGFH